MQSEDFFRKWKNIYKIKYNPISFFCALNSSFREQKKELIERYERRYGVNCSMFLLGFKLF